MACLQFHKTNPLMYLCTFKLLYPHMACIEKKPFLLLPYPLRSINILYLYILSPQNININGSTWLPKKIIPSHFSCDFIFPLIIPKTMTSLFLLLKYNSLTLQNCNVASKTKQLLYMTSQLVYIQPPQILTSLFFLNNPNPFFVLH